jgi:large subunit ribosomal protein L22
MPGVKTNERPGTRAVLRHSSIPPQKARQVLDLIRGEDADRATEILAHTERQAALEIGKVLASAIANAVHNDHQDAEDLYVSACYADEATTLKRWRPRARGRASRIRKRASHVTIIVSRMEDDRLARRRAERDANAARRSRRVTESRRRADLSGRLTRRRHVQAEAEEARLAAEAEELDDATEFELDDEDVVIDETVAEDEDTEEADTEEEDADDADDDTVDAADANEDEADDAPEETDS